MNTTELELLQDMRNYIESTPCACIPFFEDEPEGMIFGPSCDRCKLIERIDDLNLKGILEILENKA